MSAENMVLSSTYPRQVLTGDMDEMTLSQLGLAPSGVVVVRLNRVRKMWDKTIHPLSCTVPGLSHIFNPSLMIPAPFHVYFSSNIRFWASHMQSQVFLMITGSSHIIPGLSHTTQASHIQSQACHIGSQATLTIKSTIYTPSCLCSVVGLLNKFWKRRISLLSVGHHTQSVSAADECSETSVWVGRR